jgi:hypothetical protein
MMRTDDQAQVLVNGVYILAHSGAAAMLPGRVRGFIATRRFWDKPEWFAAALIQHMVGADQMGICVHGISVGAVKLETNRPLLSVEFDKRPQVVFSKAEQDAFELVWSFDSFLSDKEQSLQHAWEHWAELVRKRGA